MTETLATNRVIVEISAIRKNITNLKSLIENKKFFAVIKADAYGLGALELMKNIDDIVDGYCVSSVDEGLELRQGGTQKDILNLGYTRLDQVEIAAKNNISIAIYDEDYSRKINEILKDLSLTIKGHIKLDTGHGRLGFRESQESLDHIEAISKLSNIDLVGIFSHLATADEANTSYTLEQKEIFDRMIQKLEDRGIVFENKHLANDAGFIKHKIVYDLVRAGICLYGAYPSDVLEEEREVEIHPIFSWLSKVSFVKNIEEGTAISYGRTFIAESPMKIATVAVGYADGYKRANSNKGYVLINGQKANVVGRVTMDQIMVDVTHIEDVQIGDDVVLIGESGDQSVTVEELASWADTISYEIMTSISKRVLRIYQ